MSKNILVFGASGHTAKRLVRRLVEGGHTVRALMRYPDKMHVDLRKRVEVVRAGFEDREKVLAATAGVDAVYAMTHIKYAPKVVDIMKAARVERGIFMSSTRRFTKFPEETARQVIEGERIVRDSGLNYTIIRASMIYGADEDNNLTHLVNALRRWPVHPLVGGGQMKWQPVLAWDMASALVAALERPETIGKDYTVAGPEPITYREMVTTILREAGLRRVLVPIPFGIARAAVSLYGKVAANPRIKMDQIARLQEDKVFDISEARRDLGFTPVSFEEGIRMKLQGKA